jgi:peptide/nickel transport system substrate-binding protein
VKSRAWLGALALILTTGCNQVHPVPPRNESSAAAAPARTLIMVTRAEPTTLGGTLLANTGLGQGVARRLANAALTLLDGDANPRPYLAESLPRLGTESWQVFPDGRMITTYRLKPDLTWHDGTALVAGDFVFASDVYRRADFGTANLAPHNLIEHVEAPDPQTIVFRWRGSYPGAGALAFGAGAGTPSFTPLPRHVLERGFRDDSETFLQLPFWTIEFVGTGPYRVDRWEPGALMEVIAFAGHALGRPKIERIRMLFMSDPNAALATLLAGEAHLAVDDSIRIEQGLILKREWETRSMGTVQFRPISGRTVRPQHRAEFAQPAAMLDVRVRRALAHAIDKQAINDALLSGVGTVSDTVIAPTEPYYLEIERVVPRYFFDPRRTDELIQQAGFTRGSDGFFVSPADGRLNFEVKNNASAQNDAERAILADGWRRAGFEIQEAAFAVQGRDTQALSTYRSIATTGGVTGEDILKNFTTANISSAANRWVGQNRGGWSNPEYDRLVEAVFTTLDENERVRAIAQAAKLLNEDVAIIPLYYTPSVLSYVSGLAGIRARSLKVDPEWNVHEWQFR